MLKKLQQITKNFSTIQLTQSNRVIINDRIYGQHQVTEPLLKEIIIKSQIFNHTFQITQHGTPALLGWTLPVSRAEHMMGSYLLVQKAGGSVDQQVAALIHDITHRAFSHIIDIVYSSELNGKSLHQQNIDNYLGKTDIPKILGQDWNYQYFDLAQYPLLEQPSPFFCADRGDYTARDLFAMGLVDEKFTKKYYEHVVGVDGAKMALNDIDFARNFTQKTLLLDNIYYNSPTNIGIYNTSSEILKRSLEIKQISFRDFQELGCAEIWNRVIKSNDDQIQQYTIYLENEMKLIRQQIPRISHFVLLQENEVSNNKSRHTDLVLISSNIKRKVRYFEPWVVNASENGNNQEVQLISSLDQKCKNLIEEHQQGYPHITSLFYSPSPIKF